MLPFYADAALVSSRHVLRIILSQTLLSHVQLTPANTLDTPKRAGQFCMSLAFAVGGCYMPCALACALAGLFEPMVVSTY
jgi:hypothetical protein